LGYKKGIGKSGVLGGSKRGQKGVKSDRFWVLGVRGSDSGGGRFWGSGGSKVTVLGVKKGSKSGGFERFLRGF